MPSSPDLEAILRRETDPSPLAAGRALPRRGDTGFGMNVGTRLVLRRVLIGILVGGLGGLVVVIVIPHSELLVNLGAVVIGASFGAFAAWYTIILSRGNASSDNEAAKTR